MFALAFRSQKSRPQNNQAFKFMRAIYPVVDKSTKQAFAYQLPKLLNQRSGTPGSQILYNKLEQVLGEKPADMFLAVFNNYRMKHRAEIWDSIDKWFEMTNTFPQVTHDVTFSPSGEPKIATSSENIEKNYNEHLASKQVPFSIYEWTVLPTNENELWGAFKFSMKAFAVELLTATRFFNSLGAADSHASLATLPHLEIDLNHVLQVCKSMKIFTKGGLTINKTKFSGANVIMFNLDASAMATDERITKSEFETYANWVKSYCR